MMVTISVAPMAPWSRRAFSAAKFGSKRRLKPIISGMPAASTTFRQDAIRFASRSTGFSQKTAFLVAAHFSMRSACVSVGVPISTASMSFAGDDLGDGAHRRAGLLGERLGRGRVGVGERDQLRIRRLRDVAAVNLADAPRAEQAKADHCLLLHVE